MPLDPALYWLMMGVMLVFLALALPGFVLIFFAAGALVTALLVWFVPATSIILQLGIFLAVSFCTLLSLKRIVERRFSPAANAEKEEGGI